MNTVNSMNDVNTVDEVDVAVIGTGAAGLTAAIRAHDGGARVGLFEKADTVGGTSAWSGGMVWIPGNPHQAAVGVTDSREDALRYLEALGHGLIDPDLAAALIDTGPEMVSWLEAHTPVEFTVVEGFPDYHPEHPGARPGGGRSLECPLYPFDRLGEWAKRVSVGYQLSGNIVMSETPLGKGPPDGVPAAELDRRRRRDERGTGQSLVGRLLRGCLDRGIEPRTGLRATRLLTGPTGRITGVRLTPTGESRTSDRRVSHFVSASLAIGDGESRDVRAGAVILACGGFEWDRELVGAFLRGPLERAVSVPTNTGDGLRMAMRVGAALGNMGQAWWVPTIDVPRDGRQVAWQVNGERTRPRCIMVNRSGRRFTNEAANYNAFGAAFHVLDPNSFDYPNSPCWMVFDQGYLGRYGLAGHRAGEPTPDWLHESPTVAGLASAAGIDPAALETTIGRWNTMARAGRDDDFRRGVSVHDRWWGDHAQGDGAAATLGPLDQPPYYAVRVRSGALGTKGGPRTDPRARVLDVDGRPIPGLYAAGNVMASPMGPTYGGAGGTLGPAMVFGYLAGTHAASPAAGAGRGQPPS